MFIAKIICYNFGKCSIFAGFVEKYSVRRILLDGRTQEKEGIL